MTTDSPVRPAEVNERLPGYGFCMPRRTNIFQEIVAIIHEHMAGDARVEESAMLINRATGRKREVDVVIRSQVAGYDLIVAVEAIARGRRADAPWVESMIAKHAELPTSKLVLVSEAGFSAAARELAEAKGVGVVAPEDLNPEHPDFDVLAALPSLRPKHVTIVPQRTQLTVTTPSGASRALHGVPLSALLHLEDGTTVGTLGDVLVCLGRRMVDSPASCSTWLPSRKTRRNRFS
jgi:hypothetical protein